MLGRRTDASPPPRGPAAALNFSNNVNALKERKTMKPLLSPKLLVMITAALLVHPTVSKAQPVEFMKPPANHAFAASPRAKEAYPWLTRLGSAKSEGRDTASELRGIKQHRSLATSPRMLELHPELARLQPKQARVDTRPPAWLYDMARTSPRAREELAAYALGMTATQYGTKMPGAHR